MVMKIQADVVVVIATDLFLSVSEASMLYYANLSNIRSLS
jgi:hypothetical protein